MSINTTHFSQVGQGFPRPAYDGWIVTCAVPAGCILRRLIGGSTSNVEDVTDSSPFTNHGENSYRIDCVSITSPVTAILGIEGVA